MTSSIVQVVPIAVEFHQLLVESLWTSFYSWEYHLALIHQYKAADLGKHNRPFELNVDQCT